ncbi:MAG: hypothetical protein EG826_14625 [Deltaproteobacteria bacterium]|nr:hypothetical protein [Deltaproteobacteria bacterium]
MTDLWTYIASWSVLKWVLLVLIAGFIGQFGRMLAQALIAWVRRHRAGRGAEVQQPVLREKSSVSSSGVSSPEPPPPAASDAPDKKALKSAAKARKKEAKKRE